MAVPIAEGLVEEKFPPRKETTFLEEVEHVAVAAENMLWGIRSQYFPYGTPSLDELLCPDHLQGLIISQAQMADLLRQYITAVPLHQKIPVAHHRSSDIVIESANVWSGDPVAWEREVRTSIRKHLDALVHAFEKEAAQKAQTLEEELERTASRLYHLAYEAYGSSEQKAPPTIRFGGLLTGRIKELQNELQAAAKLRYPDDFKLLYELSFKAVVEAKGWDKLNDEQLAEALERKQVPLLIFEGYTGREITPPKKKPETVAEVIAEVKRKAEHYSRGGSSDLRSIDGQIILMPKKSTYVLGTQALREACAKEPNSPHPVFTRADGTQIYRSLTFHEDLLARVTDFNTEHDASGAQRSLADRLRLFDHWLDSCTGTAYEAGTDMMKIIPACEPLIIIPGD
ncbi:MAG: hypothetical protein Q8R53_05955, partial [Nanoarchaeota archaeon]|nr:hypothetical protein [Nanoarchaeota archaeon]